jgi:hypothetical protein
MNAISNNSLRRLALTLILVAMPLTATAGFDWDIQHTGSANAFFEIEAFHTFVTNTGALTDTVMVNMAKTVPDEWVASLCEELLCYPPFLLDIELILAPGQTTELIIDITPITNLGKGSTLITLVSKNNPADTASSNFTVVSSELEVLYVSGLNNGGDDALFTDAITAAGKTHAVWDQAEMGKATATDLGQYHTVVWANGASILGFDSNDMANISDYVAGGGDILFSAQNLAFAFCAPGSPFFDANALSWFQTTLGTDYVADTGSIDFVASSAGESIFDGASYNINGGNGSNNNTSPDVLAPIGLGATSLTYSGGGGALIRTTQGDGKTAFAGFGFEGIASVTERTEFMDLMFTWFANQASAVGDDLQPRLARNAMAWPNPFNPQTSIRFDVGGNKAQPAVLTVYDLTGRAVRHLFVGDVRPGPNSITWNGQDDSGRNLATGVYLARVQVAQEQQIVKMTLVK